METGRHSHTPKRIGSLADTANELYKQRPVYHLTNGSNILNLKSNHKTMNSEETIYKLLVCEVFGKDYFELTHRNEQDPQTSERNAKLCLIEDINACRKLMGDKPCVDRLFYVLYDLSIETLQNTLIKFQDDSYHYAREKGLLNKNFK